MSVLEIYINWVNSVLGEAGGHVDGVEAVQDGKVLCELIDVLAPDAGLQAKVKSSGECTALAYINTALEHMRSHGIKIKFPPEDIAHNEIKSMLDVLWLLILNYGIHHIGQKAVQRSVGSGKKMLLEWCQEELGAAFDHKNTLTFNLCNGNWFVKLLEKVAGCSMQKSEEKSEYIDALLDEIQDRYLIMKDIIKSNDIVDGTVDEHTLMIYLSLVKRRTSLSGRQSQRQMYSTDGKAAAMAKIHFFEKRARSLSNDSTTRSKSVDSATEPLDLRGRSQSSGGRSSSANSDVHRGRSRSLFDQVKSDGNETSDWSSTGSLFSGREKSSPQRVASPQSTVESETLLQQTISERVTEHMPEAGDGGKESESQMISEKETDTQSEYTSSAQRKDKPPSPGSLAKLKQKYAVSDGSKGEPVSSRSYSSTSGSSPGRGSDVLTASEPRVSPGRGGVESRSPVNTPTQKRSEEASRRSPVSEERLRIKIKRPKDYIRQWEDTMGRLSGSSVTDDTSPRSPLISSLRSRSSEMNGSFRQEREITISSRSRSNDLTTLPASRISSTSSTNIRGVFGNGSEHRNGATSNGFKNGSDDQSLEAILDKLPEDVRQQAAEASKFLMHNSGPEVINLIDAIKRAREGNQATMPKEEYRYSSRQGGDSERARREHSGSLTSGSRVRFQQGNSTSERSRRHTSEGSTKLSMASTSSSAVSPRLHSLSPGRNRSGASESERGSETMLSISPSDRSRSVSPRDPPLLNRNIEKVPKSPRMRDSSEGGSASRPLREELLLRNLGLNSRVVEDERPSSRIKALAASPRQNGHHPLSPERGQNLSSRKQTSVERLQLNSVYPEVTRLELGLDSDRSYVSQSEEPLDTPPARRGGIGRVPRREAWEQQKRRKNELTLPEDKLDSAAQSKFIDVLCKEIDVLKEKIETMEDEGARRSISRPSRSPSATGTSGFSTSASRREVKDENNEMIFSASPGILSPNIDTNTSCPLLETSSRSKVLKASSPRKTSGSRSDNTVVKRPVLSSQSPVFRSRNNSSSTTAARGNVRSANPSMERQHGRISLGYSSPARSVTQEIWGNDLSTPEGLDPNRQEKWKQLISSRELSDAEVIELKQALACAIVENDILQAKLNNARHEIHDKLRHTNEVLDDCRRHLAKSQAENMELRTKLEDHRQKGEGFESRIKELENNVFEVRADRQQLEDELDQTSSLLDKSITETKPGVDALRAENARLVSRLAKAENENDALKDDIHKSKRSHTKAMNTVDELRDCLNRVRRERQELYEEVTNLQRKEQTSRVRDIISSYQEKGSKDESEHERSRRDPQLRPFTSNQEFIDSDEGIFSGSQTSYDNQFSSNLRKEERSFDLDMSPVRSGKVHGNVSYSGFTSPQLTPRRSSSQQPNHNVDDLSPTRFREIYPHRKTYQPRSRSCSPPRRGRRAVSPSDLYSRLDESFVDQTLQEIEQDMMRERDILLSRVPLSKRRLRFSSYLSDENLAGNENNTTTWSKGSKNYDCHHSLDHSGYMSDVPRRSSSVSYRYKNSYSSDRNISPDSLDRSYGPGHRRSTSSSPFRPSPRPGILKGNAFSRNSTRSRSPSAMRGRRGTSLQVPSGFSTPERSRSPVYFPREAHSPPTRLSPEDKEKSSTGSRRPLHAKSGAGEIARNLQHEFDKEDKLLTALSKSTVFKNKSWLEMQSDSDDEDTGINSSVSSLTSSDRASTARKKTPLLTEEQKRYADILIEKYTRNSPML